MRQLAGLYSASIVETIREPLIVLDTDLRIKSANTSFYSYFKTTERDTEDKILLDLADGRWQNENFKNELLKVQYTGINVDEFQIEMFLPEIGERILLLNIRPMLHANLKEQLILITINDISEIHIANNILETKNNALEDINKELTSFNYILSHDLQEPLRKIHTFSKLIADDYKSKLSVESTEHINRILVSTRRMQQLTEDLLNYSQIGSSDNYQLFDTDMNIIIQEGIDELRDSITSKAATVKVSKFPVLRAIPILVRQLFINLIGNAIKYSDKNLEPVITIEGKEIEDNEMLSAHGKYYKIIVADNGIGFPNEQAVKIFDPFYRLHGKDKYDGTGIGLAICKKIMAKHQGFITAESLPGNGATFTLYFPLQRKR
ncbi:ATP-binding protein [Flavobacterium sp. DG1-102-2]|uniref:sensor histidine kinase n=1 Tax=Flavobacterium sp. DG1-102-2 TaxID=3081663 RepID=UPI002949C757|nr:ATP-binding protein [Flavobacterium sp. DG1-102-2]MDV6167209.1 ATP-binding protein [Flavobacterium sp. DG1-102-2]